MKITKRIIGVLLTLTMVLSSSVFALTFPDVSEKDTNQEAIDVLSSLGIIKGYEDGQFKPDKGVTRAELTSLLMRMLNLSITGTSVADSGYTDVANNHWAVYDIKTASAMEIIKGYGDGRFGPEDSVTYEQAVKMIVCTLGYEYAAVEQGGWPSGYIMVAKNLKLLDKASMAQTEPAPRKIIAQLLFNSLEVDLMDKKNTAEGQEPSYEILKGTNVMNHYMKMEKVEGRVSSNYSTKLDNNESDVNAGEVEIDIDGYDQKFKTGTTNAEDLLGYNVIAYVQYDETKTNKVIKHIATRGKIETEVFDATEIIDFTSSKLTYEREDDDKTESVNIESDAVIIYNGKYIDKEYAFKNNFTEPMIGTVTLVDSGAGFDFIKIESYKNYLVKTVDSSAYEIYVDNTLAKDGATKVSVPIKDRLHYDIKILKNNEEVGFTTIRKGNIISVKSTDASQVGIQLIEILVSDKKQSGKITGIHDEKIKIESEQYELSESLKGTSIESSIINNASGTYYLDSFGKIAYIEFNTGDTYKYGYIVKTGLSNNAGEYTGAVKIYDYSSKTHKNYKFHTKVMIDGKSYSDHEAAIDRLNEIASDPKLLAQRKEDVNVEGSQPVKYLYNSSGDITEINTVYFASTETDAAFVPGVYDEEAEYNSSNKYFKSGSKTIATVDSKTIIFSVPNNRSESNKYSIKSYSYFRNYTPYAIQVVETASSGNAAIIILYESDYDSTVHYSSPTVVVSEKKSVMVDGISRTKVVGYNFINGNEVEYIAENNDYVEDLTKGDVIKFGVNSDGQINENVHILLKADEVAAGNVPENKKTYSLEFLTDKDNYPIRKVVYNELLKQSSRYVLTPSLSSLSGQYGFFLGTVMSSITDGARSIAFTDAIPTDSGFNAEEVVSYTFSVPDTTVFYEYNSNEASSNMLKVTKGTSDDTNVADVGTTSIKTYDTSKEDCDNVFILIVEDKLRVVYLIK